MLLSMNVNKLCLIFLVSVAFDQISAQKNIMTTSGQKILLYDDGTWVTEKKSITEDTSGMLITEFNPLTAPKVEKYEIDEKQRMAIKVLLNKAKSNEIEHLLSIENISKQISGKELELSQAKLNKNKEVAKIINTEINDLKSKLKDSSNQYAKSTSQIKSVEKLIDQNADSRADKMKSLADDLRIDISSYIIDAKSSQKSDENKIQKKETNAIGCKILKDEKRGKIRVIQSEGELLFDYTPGKLKSYFKTNNLITTNASVSKEGKDYYLHLQLSIMSKDAAKNYGFIAEESLLRIFLINGRNLALHSSVRSTSRIENYTGNTIYEVYYPLKKEDLNNLMKFPLDSIGIMWSSGFEKYEIFQVDVLMNHINCLNSL